MRFQILYVDCKKDMVAFKALKKQGEVYFAPDINEALYLIAENQFDYFFVDADTPQAQGFIKHLRHDPQLPPPRAIVLLTENNEEDCEAWAVDTFVTKSRAKEDVPYVFSHMKGEPHEKAEVVRIAPDYFQSSARGRASRRLASQVLPGKSKGAALDVDLSRVSEVNEAPGSESRVPIASTETFAANDEATSSISETRISSGVVQSEESMNEAERDSFVDEKRDSFADDLKAEERNQLPRQTAFHLSKRISPEYIEEQQEEDESRFEKYRGESPGGNFRRRKLFFAFSAVFVFAIAAIFFYLKLPKGETEKHTAGEDKSIRAESPAKSKKKPVSELLKGYEESVSSSVVGTASTTQGAESSNPSVPESGSDSKPATKREPETNPQPVHSENNSPRVSIQGPGQVLSGQVATYTAVASDPDGDSISYSWGSSSKSFCWSSPGYYTVSVTVTDSRGKSASASITVQVI
ncbi:MAG: hypothetical protein PHP64_04580 [Actinomycetota bacterium]|nr:hypothetical protein [Actinomycetota bacterium]